MVRGRFGVGFRFFFRVKCDASHLVYFFLAAVKGFRAMEGTNETDAKAWEWTATRKCATRNVFDWIFFSCRRHAGGVDGRWSPFLRAFFSSFSLLFWVDVEAVKNETTDILVTLSLSQSSAAACAPTNTRSSVNTTS